MKTIIKITLLSLLTPLFAGAMQQNQMAAQSSQPSSTTSNWPTSKVLPFSLPKEVVQNHILPQIGNNTGEVGANLRSLRLANKCLRNLIDSDATNTLIIPQIARQTNLYEWETALALRTLGARNFLRRRYTPENHDLKIYEFDDLKDYLDDHIFEQNPTQEELKRIRFLIHCFPSITEIGKNPALTLGGLKDSNVVRNLIAAGMNVNHTNQKMETPLMRACTAKDVSTVRLLLEAGADISLRSRSGADAFSCAQIPLTVLNPALIQNLQANGVLVLNPNPNIPNITEVRVEEKIEILRLLEEAKRKQDEQKGKCSIQ